MIHGSRNTYLRHKCRCDPCTDANSAYKARRVEQLRDQQYPVHRQRKQWPLSPLLELVPDLRERLNLDTEQIRRAEEGMSDRTADRWATRCGYHPVSVWGWAWVDAGLRVTDEQFIYGAPGAEPGWRQAALHLDEQAYGRYPEPVTEMCPALRQQPGHRPTPTEGADMTDHTCAVNDVHVKAERVA